jgi:hypothetical protein
VFGRLRLPDHEPVFLNEGMSIAELELEKMEALRSVVSRRDKARLEEDIRLRRAGIAGERKIVYELMNSHYPLVFIHDLHLQHMGTSAQIDFLVVTPHHIVVLETKNLTGDIAIDESGAFVRTTTRRGRTVREGVYSPIAQNVRHINLMKACMMADHSPLARRIQGVLLDDYYRPLVVLANERTVLTADRAPEATRRQVIRADQLAERIRAIDAASSKRDVANTFAEMEAIAASWLARNVPTKTDLAATYTIEMTEAIGAKAGTEQGLASEKKAAKRPRTPVATERKATSPTPVAGGGDGEPPTCPVCGAPMVLRTARRGKNKGGRFWGCSTYGTTRCRGIVGIDGPDAGTGA